jgi:hypothetical protein
VRDPCIYCFSAVPCTSSWWGAAECVISDTPRRPPARPPASGHTMVHTTTLDSSPCLTMSSHQARKNKCTHASYTAFQACSYMHSTLHSCAATRHGAGIFQPTTAACSHHGRPAARMRSACKKVKPHGLLRHDLEVENSSRITATHVHRRAIPCAALRALLCSARLY